MCIPAIAGDGALYPVEKMEAHRLGLLHLAVSVFIFSGEEILIQRRAADKYHCGGQWANSCCTHPHWGEPLGDAASRRTWEELRISIALEPGRVITYFAPVGTGLIEHEQVQVFHGKTDKHRLRLAPDPDEVMDTRFLSRAALWAGVQAQPEDFAPWLRIYLDRWAELGLP